MYIHTYFSTVARAQKMSSSHASNYHTLYVYRVRVFIQERFTISRSKTLALMLTYYLTSMRPVYAYNAHVNDVNYCTLKLKFTLLYAFLTVINEYYKTNVFETVE
jgi:hypothetical protein